MAGAFSRGGRGSRRGSFLILSRASCVSFFSFIGYYFLLLDDVYVDRVVVRVFLDVLRE